jgi:acetyl-CoA synthetase
VAEAAVVPSPDALRLSLPKAFVALKPGVEANAETAREILLFCKERLAPYKRIRRIEFTELPKTISGKIRRVQLRNQEKERRSTGERGASEFWLDELDAKPRPAD